MRRRAFFFLRPFSRGLVRPVITTLTPRAPARVRSRQRSMPAQKHIPPKEECIQVTATYFFGSNQTPTGTPRQQRRTDQPATSQDNNFSKTCCAFSSVTPIGKKSGKTIGQSTTFEILVTFFWKMHPINPCKSTARPQRKITKPLKNTVLATVFHFLNPCKSTARLQRKIIQPFKNTVLATVFHFSKIVLKIITYRCHGWKSAT